MFTKTVFHISFVLAMLTGVVLPSAAEAAPRYATLQIPVYGNIVETEMPFEWQHKPAFQKAAARSYILEVLPKGQTLTEWQEMITVTGSKGTPFSAKESFNTLQRQHEFICGKKNVATTVYQDSPDLFMVLLKCGGVLEQFAGLAGLKKDQGEMALYKIEKRDGNLYMIFKSWRGRSYDSGSARGDELPASEKDVSDYLDVLKRSTLVKKPSR